MALSLEQQVRDLRFKICQLEKLAISDDLWVSTVNFASATTILIPALKGKRYRVFWIGYGFLAPVYIQNVTSGGFTITIPGFDVTLDINNTFNIQFY